MSNQPPLHLVIANRYVIFRDLTGRFAKFRQEQTKMPGDLAVGYVYIDHEAGLSMRIHLFIEQMKNGDLRLSQDLNRPGGHVMIMRSDMFPLLDIMSILTTEDAERVFQLPAEPSYLSHYRNTEVEPLRALEILHPLRAPGFPDDITFAMIKDEGEIIEHVWGRLERRLSDEQFECTLLNQPNNDFGVRVGDRVIVSVTLTPEGIDARFVSKSA